MSYVPSCLPLSCANASNTDHVIQVSPPKSNKKKIVKIDGLTVFTDMIIACNYLEGGVFKKSVETYTMKKVCINFKMFLCQSKLILGFHSSTNFIKYTCTHSVGWNILPSTIWQQNWEQKVLASCVSI